MSQSIKLNDDLYWDVSSLKGVVPSSGGAFNGAVQVYHTNGTAGTTKNTYIEIGNDIDKSQAGNSRGILRIFGDGTYYTNFRPLDGITSNHNIYLPDKNGTIALTSDLSNYVSFSDMSVHRADIIGTDASSVANNTATDKGTVTIDGACVVIITVQWSSNANGYRQIAWSSTSQGGGVNLASTSVVQPVNGAETRQQLVVVDTASASSPITRYIVVRQNSGLALACSCRVALLKFNV